MELRLVLLFLLLFAFQLVELVLFILELDVLLKDDLVARRHFSVVVEGELAALRHLRVHDGVNLALIVRISIEIIQLIEGNVHGCWLSRRGVAVDFWVTDVISGLRIILFDFSWIFFCRSLHFLGLRSFRIFFYLYFLRLALLFLALATLFICEGGFQLGRFGGCFASVLTRSTWIAPAL